MTRTRLTLAAVLTLAAAGITVAATEGAFAHGKGGMMKPGDHATRMEQRFKDADTDRDGKLSAAEMRATRTARFAAADTDGDGKVTVDELDAARRAERIERLTRMVVWLDVDGDGMLSVDEFDPRRGAMLARLDADGDGALSQEEMRDGHKRFNHRHGGRHGGSHGRHAPQADGQKN